MSTTIQNISNLLESKAVKHRVEENRDIILANWQLPAAGKKGLNVVFDLQEEGEFVMLSAVRVLECPTEHPHLGAVLRAMAESTWKTKMMRWEYDSSDGEVRASIHIPVEDGELTESQLHRALGCLLQMCDRYIPILRYALKTGKVDLSSSEIPPDGAATVAGFLEKFRSFLETADTTVEEADDEDLPDGLSATELDDFLGETYRGGDREPLN